MIKATNEDIGNKLQAEKDNYDNLLRDKMETEERLARLNVVLAEDRRVVEEQKLLLAELKALIEEEQTQVDALNESVVENRKIKKSEDERYRHVQQQYTALEAKQTFIETNYDYTKAPDEMDVEIFRRIMESNNEVNETVTGFVAKVGEVKKEVTKIIQSRQTF